MLATKEQFEILADLVFDGVDFCTFWTHLENSIPKLPDIFVREHRKLIVEFLDKSPKNMSEDQVKEYLSIVYERQPTAFLVDLYICQWL